MKNTVKLLGIIALVAVIGFSFAACNDGGDDSPGGGGDAPNMFSLTQINNSQYSQGQDGCLVGLFPTTTTRPQAVGDAQKILGNDLNTTYCVAGEDDPEVTGTNNNYTIGGPLKSASSGYTSLWRGEGTFHVWLFLQNGNTVTVYRTTNPVTVTPGEHISRSAQADFSLQQP